MNDLVAQMFATRMQRLIFIAGIVLALFLCPRIFAQTGVRVPAGGGQLTTTAVINGTTVIVPKAATTIQFCNRPANAVPCSNKATTYTDAGLGTPCATSTQVVLDGTTSCIAGSDSLGNWGVWVASGNYEWTFTDSAGNSFGPYFVTANSSPSIKTWNSNTDPTGNLTLSLSTFQPSIFRYTKAAGTPVFVFEDYNIRPLGDAISLMGDSSIVLGAVADTPSAYPSTLGYLGQAANTISGFTANFQIAGWQTSPGVPTKVTVAQTSGIAFGICQVNCTSAGTPPAIFAIAGTAQCLFDGATTAGDWVIISTTVAGDCHDTGSTAPPATTVTTIGRVLTTNAVAGTYKVALQLSR